MLWLAYTCDASFIIGGHAQKPLLVMENKIERLLISIVGCVGSLILAAFTGRAQNQPDASQHLSRITVDPGGRFLDTENGRPFFWLGDTAWELIHHTIAGRMQLLPPLSR